LCAASLNINGISAGINGVSGGYACCSRNYGLLSMLLALLSTSNYLLVVFQRRHADGLAHGVHMVDSVRSDGCFMVHLSTMIRAAKYPCA